MSLLVFVGVFQIGNPLYVLVPPDASAQDMAKAAAELGLDRPLWEQYLRFVRDAASGELGRSFVFNRPATTIILERLPATFELASVALLLTVALGLPLGLLAGLKPDGPTDRTIMFGSILGFSLPSFWVGLILIMAFSVGLQWLPSTGRGATASLLGLESSLFTADGWAHIVLPAFNLALFNIALVIRLVRAGTREAMLSDYIKFARAKGLTRRRIVLVHVLSNILVPVVTVLGLEFGSLIAFAVVTESIFTWPGMGKLIVDSINLLDRPVIVTYLLLTVLLVIAINFTVDILYSLLDPRIRLGSDPA